MGHLSDDLREMGFVTTGDESPVDEDGTIWRNGVERVCDETGIVIDGNHHSDSQDEDDEVEQEMRCGEPVYRYSNSDRVKLIGGYVSNYFD